MFSELLSQINTIPCLIAWVLKYHCRFEMSFDFSNLMLSAQHPDIVIWLSNAKTVYFIEIMFSS